jgi:hypothetical protein
MWKLLPALVFGHSLVEKETKKSVHSGRLLKCKPEDKGLLPGGVTFKTFQLCKKFE